MKKYFNSLLLIISTLTMLLSGCESKKGTINEFVEPSFYIASVKITINPVVELYLDEGNTVIAVEYLNGDAKNCYSKIEKNVVGAIYKNAVAMLVEKAAADGYLESNNKINIDVMTSITASKEESLLKDGKESAQKILKEKKLEGEVSVVSSKEVEKLNKQRKEQAKKQAAAKRAAEERKAAQQKAEEERLAAEQAAKKAEEERLAAEAAQKAQEEETAEEKTDINKLLKQNTNYKFYQKTEDDNVRCLVFTFSGGTYSFSEKIFTQTEAMGVAQINYSGVTYYETSTTAQLSGNYTLTDELIVLSGEIELEFNIQAENKIVVKNLSKSDFGIRVGNSFIS